MALFVLAATNCEASTPPSLGRASQAAAESLRLATTESPNDGTGKGRASAVARPRFAWPVSYGVPVRERTVKGGVEAETSYVVRLCPGVNGGFRVEHSGFRFVSLGGIPADDPRIRQTIDQITPLGAVIPALILDASGRGIEVEGIDELLAGMEKSLPEFNAAPLRQAFASNEAREVLKQAILSRWRAWVEGWIVYDPASGPTTEIMSEGFGRQVRSELTFEGWVGEHARLSLNAKLSKEDVHALLTSVSRTLGVKDMKPTMFEDPQVSLGSRVETEWPELRPHWVTTEKRIAFTIAGETTRKDETHEFRFDWEAAKPVACPSPR
jgi:hypothetical protein